MKESEDLSITLEKNILGKFWARIQLAFLEIKFDLLGILELTILGF